MTPDKFPTYPNMPCIVRPIDILDLLQDVSERNALTENVSLYVAAADEIKQLREQKRRADALAATIRALRDVVTHNGETKADFIARVRAVLSADPDARLLSEQAAPVVK